MLLISVAIMRINHVIQKKSRCSSTIALKVVVLAVILKMMCGLLRQFGNLYAMSISEILKSGFFSVVQKPEAANISIATLNRACIVGKCNR